MQRLMAEGGEEDEEQAGAEEAMLGGGGAPSGEENPVHSLAVGVAGPEELRTLEATPYVRSLAGRAS